MTKSNNEINNTVSEKINEKLFTYTKKIGFIPNTILVFNIKEPFKNQLQNLFPQAEITVIHMADLKESHFTLADASVDLLLANITIVLDLDLNRLFLDAKRILSKNGLFIFSTYDSSSKLILEKYITKNAQQLILDERVVKRDLDKLYSLSYFSHEEQIKISDTQSQALNIDIFTVTHMDAPEEADLLKRVNIESAENEKVESKNDKETQEIDKTEKVKAEANTEQELEEMKEPLKNEKIEEKEEVLEKQELKEKEEEKEKPENKDKVEKREKPEDKLEALEEKEKIEKNEIDEEKPEFEEKASSEKQESPEKVSVDEREEVVKEAKESKEGEERPEENESEEKEEVDSQESEEQQENENPEEKETDLNKKEKSEEGEEPEVDEKEKYKEKFSHLENEMQESKEQLAEYAEKLTQHLNDSADIINALAEPNLSLEAKKNKLAELQARNLEHKKMLTAYQNLHSQHRALLNSFILSQEKVLEQHPYLNDQYHQLVKTHRELLNKHDENIKEHQLFLKLT